MLQEQHNTQARTRSQCKGEWSWSLDRSYKILVGEPDQGKHSLDALNILVDDYYLTFDRRQWTHATRTTYTHRLAKDRSAKEKPRGRLTMS